MGRARKIHYPKLLGFLPPPALCDTPDPLVTLRLHNVTCLRCMFFLGLYVPLDKLREHQWKERHPFPGSCGGCAGETDGHALHCPVRRI